MCAPSRRQSRLSGWPVSLRPSELTYPGPLVGRGAEMAAFSTAVRAVTAGRASVIHLSGETGIGRTRLLQEFVGHAREHGATTFLTRACRADEAPLGPLLQAQTDRELVAFSAALAASDHVADPFDRLVTALASDARATPLWLMLDDLQASDESTQTFAERLLAAARHGALRDARVGVVLCLKSGPDSARLRDRLDAQDRTGAGLRILLKGFDAAEVRTWLTARLPAEPDDDLARMLREASGGNPLLLSELVVHLERTRRLRQVDGRMALSPSSDGGTLPRDLTSLLQGKIRAISDDCRRAMTVAAFLGNEFDSLALGDLLKHDGARLDALIDEAAAASLVERRGECRVGFKHAFARDLFYRSTDHQRREETHLQVCEGLIGELGEHADEHCLTITHHLIRAGARADPRLVLRFARRAADLAFGHHSYYLAGRYYESAAHAARGLLPDDVMAGLHCSAGEAYQRWSDGSRSSACFEEAARLFEATDDLEGHARALQGLLRNHIAFGEAGAEAGRVAARLQAMLVRLPEEAEELKVRVHDTLAGYYHNAARYDVAESCAQTAMSIARQSRDPTLRCIPVTSLAMAQMEQLRLTDARTTWLEGLSYDRAAGAIRYEGLHLQRLPVPLYCMGEIHEASRCNQASYQHNQPIGNTGELVLNLGVDVMIANLRGDFDTAVGAGREAMELMAITRYLWNAPTVIGALAYALVMREQYDEAESVIAHLSTNGLTFADTGPYRSTAARLKQLVLVHRGHAAVAAVGQESRRGIGGVRVGSLGRLCAEAELALFQRRPERLAGVHDALEFVHRRGLTLALGWCCSIPRSLAVSTALRGGMARAAGYFAEASRLAERSHSPLEQGRVSLYRGLAARQRDEADPRQAHEDLAAAQACFEELGAPALAHLARTALSSSGNH